MDRQAAQLNPNRSPKTVAKKQGIIQLRSATALSQSSPGLQASRVKSTVPANQQGQVQRGAGAGKKPAGILAEPRSIPRPIPRRDIEETKSLQRTRSPELQAPGPLLFEHASSLAPYYPAIEEPLHSIQPSLADSYAHELDILTSEMSLPQVPMRSQAPARRAVSPLPPPPAQDVYMIPKEDLKCAICLDIYDVLLSGSCCSALICEGCKPRVTSCPVCRKPAKFERQSFLDHILNNTEVTCQCGASVPRKHISTHKLTCPVERIQCPDPRCQQYGPMRKEEFCKHFSTCHKDTFMQSLVRRYPTQCPT